jgi:hypothetical protein
MAKGQLRPTKEKRKPKKDKNKAKVAPPAPHRYSSTPVQVGGGGNPGDKKS